MKKYHYAVSFVSLPTTFFGHAGDAGNECADTAAFLGMRGLISENNSNLKLSDCPSRKSFSCYLLAEFFLPKMTGIESPGWRLTLH